MAHRHRFIFFTPKILLCQRPWGLGPGCIVFCIAPSVAYATVFVYLYIIVVYFIY